LFGNKIPEPLLVAHRIATEEKHEMENNSPQRSRKT
jgi:hypothetical protein